MRPAGPIQRARRKLALEALPMRPVWTVRELAQLFIGLTPEGAKNAVLRLEAEGLVKVERPPGDAWRISLVWAPDLAAIGRWIDAELEGSA